MWMKQGEDIKQISVWKVELWISSGLGKRPLVSLQMTASPVKNSWLELQMSDILGGLSDYVQVNIVLILELGLC